MKIKKLVSVLSLLLASTSFSVEILETYKNQVSHDDSYIVPVKIKSTYGIPSYLDSVFVITDGAILRDAPEAGANQVATIPFTRKVQALQKVKGDDGNVYYKVRVVDGSAQYLYPEDHETFNWVDKTPIPNGTEGYIWEGAVQFMHFEPEKMVMKLNELTKFITEEKALGRELVTTDTYIPNPENKNFKREKDKYGTSLDQNAVGIYNGEVIHIPDRSIISIVGKEGDKYLVNVASIPERPLLVSAGVIDRSVKFNENFTKAIGVDIRHQNQIVFEKLDGVWTIINYGLVKTGIESELGFETPKGFFLPKMAKQKMSFNDENGKFLGYAQNAIRFSGGGYFHSTPIKKDEFDRADEVIETRESFLGTHTGTRKCIRNMEKQAIWLFNWFLDGKVTNSNNEQKPTSNTMVVIF